MLQYITNTDCPVSVPDQVKGVLEGGCRWIQIRMKEASDDEIKSVVEIVKPLCLEKDAFLLLDDRVELAKTLDVGGVHLGKTDMLPSKARVILGPAAVIGVTANTFDDIQRLARQGADYIGCGPFRFTTTKKNLSPILGLEGYQRIVKQMHDANINLPIVAIGGIKAEDIPAIMQTGVTGIAVSGAVLDAENPVEEMKKFVKSTKPNP